MGQSTPQSTPLHPEEPFPNFLVQSIYRYLSEHRVYRGTFAELRATLIRYTGRATGWPHGPSHLATHLSQAQPILEHLGVSFETHTGTNKRVTISLALTREPDPGAAALAAPGPGSSSIVTLEGYQAALCQGSDSPLLKEAALLLWTLGRQARMNPKLVSQWMTAAKDALTLAKEAGSLVVTSGQAGDLAAFIEAESEEHEEGQEQPPSAVEHGDGDSSMPSTSTSELE